MKITYVVTDALIPGYLDINLRLIMKDSIPSLKFLEDSLLFFETKNGKTVPLETQKVIPQRFDVVTIITDVSSSMWRLKGGVPVHMDSAKAITDSLMRSLENPYAISLYTYDEQLYRKTTEGENSFMNVERPAKARYTHLFENVNDALNRMKDAKGRKILFVIGDGENDHNKNLEVKINQADLLEKIRGLDSSYVIFPIALGPKLYEGNFQQLVSATKSLDDRVIYGKPGPQTFEYVSTLHNWPMTHTILVKSTNHPHIGADRLIEARLEHRRDTSTYRLGAVYAPWNQQANWQFNSFGGVLLVILIFVLFAFIFPYQQWRDFKKKYIKHYWEVKKEGIREYDPLTKFPFRDDDEVVVRCEHMTSLDTWQYEGRRA
ncbi:MAG TPA: VWA domain-containing protein, partial [Bacteroidetes bacterium]|nr:VWA domain-containing protein [Bacteroidota bacterium]